MEMLQEVAVPQENLSDKTVNVVLWCAERDQKISPGDPVVELETSKSVFTLEAETEGYVEYLAEEGEDVAVGSLIYRVWDEIPKGTSKISPPLNDVTDQSSYEGDALFSKAAQVLIAREEIDPSRFTGQDLVTSADVESLLGGGPASVKDQQKQKNSKAAIDLPIEISSTEENPVETERIPSEKKREISYLSDVQSANLCSSLSVYVDLQGVLAPLDRALHYFQGSLLPVVVYEVSRLLKSYRELNAFYAGDLYGFYQRAHIGIAVDNEKGLKVVKVSDADKKPLMQIDEEIFGLIDRYMDEKLSAQDLTGSTFTITDLSTQGVHFFTPLVNARQSAILGISAVDHDLNRCVFTLTFDHRVTEGKRAGEFLADLKDRVESYREELAEEKWLDASCDRCMKTLEEDVKREGPGFVRVIDHRGEEGLLCKACFQGW